jgi:hypothetical protein
VVQEDVREARRDYTPLRGALGGVSQQTVTANLLVDALPLLLTPPFVGGTSNRSRMYL